jgi:DHA1 family multidrug resistance protein-like MFS transporter
MDITLRRPGRDRPYGALLLTCCAVSFACFFGSYMRIPVLPLYAASLGAGTVEVGIINACFLSMAGALSIPLGILSDRLGRRPLVLAGLAVLAGSSFLLWQSATPRQMMCIYLLFGTGLAAFAPTMMSYVADFTPPTHLGRAYGWYTMAIYSAMTLGPAAGGFLGHLIGLRQVFLVSGGVILAMTVPVLALLPVRSAPASHEDVRPTFSEAARELLGNRSYLASLLATFGSCFGFGVFISFLPLFARTMGIEAGGTGLVFGAQALANTLSRLPFGYLSDRVARRSRLAALGLLVFSGALAGIALCSGLAQLLMVSAVLGVGMGIAFTAIGALIGETVPVRVRGFAMGGYNSCIYFGMMASSALMGLVISQIGFAGGFIVASLVTALLTGLFLLTSSVSMAADH